MESNLWNNTHQSGYYSENQQAYYNHILEQYKLYVEMTDRISSRRNLANVFFLTLNSTVLTCIIYFCQKSVKITPGWLVIFPFLGVIILCIVWWWLIRSYRNLNTAKFKVIGKLEEKLPASPYWRAEWEYLGEGKDIRKYLPLCKLENFVPLVFLLMYLLIGVYCLFM